MDKRTSYLAAALTNLILDLNDVSLDEIKSDLSEYFNGQATEDEITAELATLERADSIYSYQVDGVTYWRDNDSD